MTDDEYTSNPGNNRNTGKLPDRPKPYPNNVIRAYSLGAGDTLYQDTGSYPSFDPIVISNAIGIGDDEGFTWTGPTGNGIAELWPAHPDEKPSLVQLIDADFVTLSQLTLRDAGTGLLIQENSLNFSGSDLTSTGHRLDGLRIEDDASGSTLVGINAGANARHGIYLLSPIDLLADSRIEGNEGDGVHAVDQSGLLIRNNDLVANLGGIYLTTAPTSSATIEDNRVSASLGHGIQAFGDIAVLRNAVHDNAAIGIWGANGANLMHNVVFFNATGIQVSGTSQTSATAIENRVYENAGVGIVAYRSSDVSGNTIYGSLIGVHAPLFSVAYDGSIDSNLVYDTGFVGLLLERGITAQVHGNTFQPTAGSSIRVTNGSADVSLRNNILWNEQGFGIIVTPDSQLGFDSDYNLIYTTGAGQVGNWQGASRATLLGWQLVSAGDQNSLINDPLFVDADGPDDLRGYIDDINDGRNDDFHLVSTEGRFTGSPAPVFNTSTGRVEFLSSTEIIDATSSPAIDRGDPTSPFSQEPTPNGGFVNLGAFGNSAHASKSLDQFLKVLTPNGNETWLQDQTFETTWRNESLGSPSVLIDLELVRDSDTGFSVPIASVIANNGAFLWAVPTSIPEANDYRIRVSRSDGTQLTDTSDETFSVLAAINNYYVNLAGDTDFSDNQYTSVAGDDGNSGLTPDAPMASIAAVLAAYDLGDGDTIFVDAGQYDLISNIVIGQDDAGVQIVGSTAVDNPTILHRGNVASGSHVFELVDADDVQLESLHLTGGYHGVSAAANSDSDRVTLRNLRVFESTFAEINAQDSNDSWIIEGSIITDVASTQDGVILAGEQSAVRDSEIYGHARGLNLTGGQNLVENNLIHDNSGEGIYLTTVADIGSQIRGNELTGNNDGIFVASSGTPPTIESNVASENQSNGLEINSNAIVRGNTAFRNGITGIIVAGGGIAESNTSHDNPTGLIIESATASGNIAFNNVHGFVGRGTALLTQNRSFDNEIGVVTDSSGFNQVQVNQNFIYDNAVYGIDVRGGRQGAAVIGNSILQLDGSGVRIRQGSQDIELRNNLFEVSGDHFISVDSDSQGGYRSDFNLFYSDSGTGLLSWGSVPLADRQDVIFEIGQERHSRFSTDPSHSANWVSPAGGDGILGYSSLAVAPAEISDDGDSSFATAAIWETQTGGHDGDYQRFRSTSESDTATWTFDDLQPGATYEIAVTYPQGLWTQTARYSFRDENLRLGGAIVNQSTPPSGFIDGGSTWDTIGSVVVTGSTLEIALLATDTVRFTVADAIRIQQVEGYGADDDDFHLLPGSSAIDAGDWSDDYANEPSPNGTRVNLGAYGNTSDATISPDQLLQVLEPSGFEKFDVGDEIEIQWNAVGPFTTFDIDLIDTETNAAYSIADALPASNTTTWTIPAAIPTDRSYFVQVTANQGSMPVGRSLDPIQIGNAGNDYFVNDDSLVDDEFTTVVGDNANSGKSPDQPMRSIQAVLSTHSLESGD
ncbi:MAG: right-handed parallel beta-helix repeat-containing protein, partial [Planctomycetota bacterium]